MKSKNKKGVFGLTAVQGFFSVILGVALLAYVIVIIMGTLSGNTAILQVASYTAVNESIDRPTTAGITLATGGLSRATCSAITAVYNGSGGALITSGNYTQTGCSVVNATDVSALNSTWLVSYAYTASSNYQQNLDGILTNTSTGITSFFGAINPIYAILAVLVIILVLVVLVRVVQAPSGRETSSQL